MIAITNDIQIGHRVEKVFDIVDSAPFGIDIKECDDCYYITTQFGHIVVTGDTQLQRPNGSYIYAERIKPISTALRHVCGTAVVTDVHKIKCKHEVALVSGTDYVIVNGYYVASED